MCLLPHGGARAASLFRPGGQSVQQATTTQEVKILPAVISGADNLRSPANGDGRALEVGAEWNPRSGAKRVVRGDRTLIWVASGEATAGSDVDLLVDAEERPNLSDQLGARLAEKVLDSLLQLPFNLTPL